MTLRDWITDNALTVEQAAALIGVHRTTLHGWISGQDMPRPSQVERIRVATGDCVKVADLHHTYMVVRS